MGILKNFFILLFVIAFVLFRAGYFAQADPLPASQNNKIEKAPSDELSDDYSYDDDDEDTDEGQDQNIRDPLEPWNRIVFQFNDKLYFYVLKPLAKGYKFITPAMARQCINNFFANLKTPVRLVNCGLQAKFRPACIELARFFANTTIGLAGLFDPAKNYLELKQQDEDLGQTLGKYGLGNGIYLVWPIFGPSTARDSLGSLGDIFLDPVNYVEPGEARLGISGFEKLNYVSLHIGDYETLKEAAFDPYYAFRDGYVQLRSHKVIK